MDIYRVILSFNPYLFSICKSYLILLSLNLRSLCFFGWLAKSKDKSLLRNLSPVTSKGCADKDNATRRSIARHFATKPVRRIKNCKRIGKTEAYKKRKIDNKTMKLLDSLYGLTVMMKKGGSARERKRHRNECNAEENVPTITRKCHPKRSWGRGEGAINLMSVSGFN